MKKLIELAMRELIECINDKDIDVDSDTLGFILEDIVNNDSELQMSNKEFDTLCELAYQEAEKRELIKEEKIIWE